MGIRVLTGLVILVALQTATPQLAFAQGDRESPVEITCRGCRPGTEIRSDQLGEFLQRNLTLAFGTDMRPLSVGLRLELRSRDEGTIAEWESEVVKVEGGKPYRGSTFMVSPPVFLISAPGFGDGRKITLGRFVVINHEEQYVPRECEGSTHALRVDVDQRDGVLVHKSDVDGFLCLEVER